MPKTLADHGPSGCAISDAARSWDPMARAWQKPSEGVRETRAAPFQNGSRQAEPARHGEGRTTDAPVAHRPRTGLDSPQAHGSHIFRFTVRDSAVAADVNKQLGNRVTLTCEQHLGLPSCCGETEYFVKGVRRVEP